MEQATSVKQYPSPTCGADLRAFRLNVRSVSANALAAEMGIQKRTLLKAERDEGISIESRGAIADWFNRQPEFADVEVLVTTIWPELMEGETE